MVYGLPRVGCSPEYDTLDDLALNFRVGPTLMHLLGGEMASSHGYCFEKLQFAGRIVFFAIEMAVAAVLVVVAPVVFVEMYLKQTFVLPPLSFLPVHLTSLKH